MNRSFMNMSQLNVKVLSNQKRVSSFILLEVEIIKLCLSFPLHFFFFSHVEVIKSPKDQFTVFKKMEMGLDSVMVF